MSLDPAKYDLEFLGMYFLREELDYFGVKSLEDCANDPYLVQEIKDGVGWAFFNIRDDR